MGRTATARERLPVSRKGSLTEKLAFKSLQTQHQSTLQKISCNSAELDNVYKQDYLGASFQADGDRLQSIVKRMAIAKTAFGKLSRLWSDASYVKL